MNVAGPSAVEIAIFDLNGKLLSTVHSPLNSGNHGMALPQRSAGVYLYRVTAGNNELVLRGNAVSRISFESSVTMHGASSASPAKLAMSKAAINDVIAATKTGYLNYRVGIGNSDTSGIVITMIASAGTVTDADGNSYQTVRIGNQVWMTENLRVTKYNDGTPIPFDTSSIRINDTTPKYCFYENTINSDSIKKYGALYNGYVVMNQNPKKVAPAGWHVPSNIEVNTLVNFLISSGYNWDGTITGNKIARSLAAKTDWNTDTNEGTIGFELTKNNNAGFSALPGGGRYLDGTFGRKGDFGLWWNVSADQQPDAWTWSLCFRYSFLDWNSGEPGDNLKANCFSVRLVRD